MADKTTPETPKGSKKAPDAVRKNKPNAPRAVKGISKSSALTLAVISALAGGAIGWVGPAIFSNSGETTLALQTGLSQARTDLEAAKRERNELQSLVSGLSGNMQSQNNEIAALSGQVTAQEDTLSTLTLAATNSPVNDDIAALNARLAALSAIAGLDSSEEGEEASSEHAKAAAAFWARIDALETKNAVPVELAEKIEALESEINTLRLNAGNTAFPKPAAAPKDLPAVETAQDRAAALDILIESFPRKTMLEAVRAQEVRAAEKPSWLQRTMGKVVKVRDTDAPDPEVIITNAENALKNGQVTETISLIGKLNPPVRAVAAEWIEAAKKAAPAIEKAP